MPQYQKDKPIILYAKLVDTPDAKFNVVGVPDEAKLQDVRIVVSRPKGDRHSVLVPTLRIMDDFGTWYTATLNLNLSDELGEYTIKWIFKTTEGEITHSYTIDILDIITVPYWCFQSFEDGVEKTTDPTLPEDVEVLMSSYLEPKDETTK